MSQSALISGPPQGHGSVPTRVFTATYGVRCVATIAPTVLPAGGVHPERQTVVFESDDGWWPASLVISRRVALECLSDDTLCGFLDMAFEAESE
jgi:hypothetical protein